MWRTELKKRFVMWLSVMIYCRFKMMTKLLWILTQGFLVRNWHAYSNNLIIFPKERKIKYMVVSDIRSKLLNLIIRIPILPLILSFLQHIMTSSCIITQIIHFHLFWKIKKVVVQELDHFVFKSQNLGFQRIRCKWTNIWTSVCACVCFSLFKLLCLTHFTGYACPCSWHANVTNISFWLCQRLVIFSPWLTV